MPRITERNIDNIWALVSSEIWAMEETAARSIQEVLQLRLNGQTFTDDEVEQRLGFTNGPYQGPSVRDLTEGEMDGYGPRIVNGVAVLPLQGVLAPKMNIFMKISGGTSTQEFAKWYQQAVNNSNVKAIVFDIDSPGGMAQGNQELVDAIRSHPAGKPVKAVCMGTCASAAYYVGSTVDEIIASPSSNIGSIGTFHAYQENSKELEQRGRSIEIVRVGKNKGIPSGHEPLNDHSRGLIQERINSLNAMFISAVAVNRNMSEKIVWEKFGQGKVFLAAEALELGMIDRIGTLEQVVSELSGTSPRGGRNGNINFGKGSQMDKELLAAMVTRGLIQESDSEERAEFALQTFFAVTGQERPEEMAQVIDLLKQTPGQNLDTNNHQQQPGTPADPPGSPPAPEQPSQSESDLQASATRREAIKAERLRISELGIRGSILNIDQTQIDQAIKSGLSVEKALLQWTEDMAETNRPVGTASVTADSADKFSQAATIALSEQLGVGNYTDQELSSAGDLRGMSLVDFARKSLQHSGSGRLPDDDELIAKQALAMGGEINMINGVVQGVEAYNRPGDFPNLLSNVQGKMMQDIAEYSTATYRKWCHKISDVADFNPKTLAKLGELGELSIIQDGKRPEQATLSEEVSFIQTDRFGVELPLTVLMVTQNNLSSWWDAFQDALEAADLTLNRLCVDLLTGNVTLPDNYALFDDAAHGNHVDIGGAPSTNELDKLRTKIKKQMGVSKKRRMRYEMTHVLFPTDLDTAFEKLLRVDLRVVTTDEQNPDLFRGRLEPISEPMLDDASAKAYYGFANPRRSRPIVYAKMKGYAKPRITSFVEQGTGTRVYQLEDRFGSAVNNFRGVAKQDGEP